MMKCRSSDVQFYKSGDKCISDEMKFNNEVQNTELYTLNKEMSRVFQM